ncbi:sulfatase [Rhodopirellula sp. JC740]|uniref:Sulfatase n=1 Tax=Rhodopirellula halodulae TaxID=2894198 RepID=A0ABS8NEC1_9BACT|nr:sulfatase [Rhodopirellula sp. JC740]MCC9641895.1 sulfatase [Rhodopirellula sp. JC740]
MKRAFRFHFTRSLQNASRQDAAGVESRIIFGEWIRGVICVTLSVVLGGFALATETTPRNVLIIQTDEHNFRTLGCYRQTLSPELAAVWGKEAIVETPHIDSIAARGAICTSFYATSPVCTPSRAAFFTGRYPQNTGAYQNDRPLSSDMVTFAEVLRRNGYATGYAGKWHLDGSGKPQWEPNRKFGFSDNRFMFNRGHWKKFAFDAGQPIIAATNKKGTPSYSLDDADETSFSTDWLCDRAMDFIREHAGQPFCYHLSLPDPHGPSTVRAPYDTLYEDMAIRPPMTFQMDADQPGWLPANGRNTSSKFNARLMTLYFGMVRCIDDNVGQILALLDELQLTDQTMIVFTADHGDLCYEHGRLNKGNPYEGSAKVPMIVAGEGVVTKGLQIDETLGTVDFAPTLFGLLGYRVPDSMQGLDASKWFQRLSGDPSSTVEEQVTFLRAASNKPTWVAAVTDRYKLIVSAEDSPWLFDLETDPHEMFNHFAKPENRSVNARLAAALLRYGDRMKDPQLTEGKLRSELQSMLSYR